MGTALVTQIPTAQLNGLLALPFALNANPGFESGTAHWAGNDNATIAAVTNPVFSGYQALRVTPDGVTNNPGAVSDPVAVTGSGVYSAVGAMRCSSAGQFAVLVVNWFTSGAAYISSTTSATFTLPVDTWTVLYIPQATAPANAASATIIPQIDGLGAVFYADCAYLLSGSWPSGLSAVDGNFTVDGHIQFGAQTPTAAAGSNNGTGAPAPVVTTGSNDGAGNITFGSGTGPSAGTQVNVTFNTPWVIPGGGAPHIVVSPANSATQALGLYLSSLSPVGFHISSANAPAASQAASTYSVNYVVLG